MTRTSPKRLFTFPMIEFQKPPKLLQKRHTKPRSKVRWKWTVNSFWSFWIFFSTQVICCQQPGMRIVRADLQCSICERVEPENDIDFLEIALDAVNDVESNWIHHPELDLFIPRWPWTESVQKYTSILTTWRKLENAEYTQKGTFVTFGQKDVIVDLD